MRRIDKIILHCSAFSKPHDIETVRAWHKQRGFKDVGYHYFITFKGQIQEGRTLETIGAHCEGFNTTSVGICLAGLLLKDFTRMQFKSLKGLLKELKQKYPKAKVYGHHDFNKKKECPVYDVAPLQDYWDDL